MKISIRNFQIILLVIIIIVNLFLLQFPLTNTIHFEFSVVNAIILFLFGGLFSIKLHKAVELNIRLAWLKIYKFLLLLICVPFVLGVLSTLFFSLCPLNEGILFFIVITIPSLLFGFITGSFISAIVWRFRNIIFFVLFVILLLLPLVEFYFNPQIYFYNPIFGFYPGTIYDEDLNVDAVLLLYRFFNFLFFSILGLYAYFPLVKRKFNRLQVLLATAVIISLFFLFKPALNFSTTFSKMTNELGKSLQTRHLNIYYPEQLEKEEPIVLVGIKHEYYFEQVTKELQLQNQRKVVSFIYNNPLQKRKLFGSGNANVAKPWSNQIYLNYSTYDISLKHELVHVLAGDFGTTPLLVAENFNTAMIEGIAMAIENDYDGYPVHYMAKMADQAGYKFPISKLFSGLSFFSQFPTVSYIYAGSFIKYLIDKYGIEKIKNLYSDIDFPKYFNKSIVELEQEYNNYLASLEIDFNKHKAQLYFGGQPIFQKYCPRTAAYETKKAWAFFNDKKYYTAKELFEKVYNYSGSHSSLRGYVLSLVKMNENIEAEKLLKAEMSKFFKSSSLYNFELILSDICIRNNKIIEAENLYDSLLVQNPHVEFSNQVLIRKSLLSVGADSLRKYLEGDANLRYDMLIRLNKDKTKNYSITTLIELAKDNTRLAEVVGMFRNKIAANDYLSAHALQKLSYVSVKLGQYEAAKEFLVYALEYKENPILTESLKSDLSLVNWIINFSEETVKHFVYK